MAADLELSTSGSSDDDLPSTCASNEVSHPECGKPEAPDEQASKLLGPCSAIPWYIWPLLVAMDGVHAMSVDAWLPSLLRVQTDFDVSAGMAALTLQCGLLASALGCIVMGPLADRVGRRRTQMFAFTLYCTGGLVGATSWNFYALLVGRILLGFGQGGQLLGQIAVRDLVDDPALRLQSMATLSSMSPLVNFSAPIVGGAIGGTLGWRWVCGLQAVWGAFVVLGSFILPGSSHPEEHEDTSVVLHSKATASTSSILTNVMTVVRSGIFVGAAGVYSLMFASVSAMLTLLPFVLEQYYGLSPTETGGLMGMVSLFMGLGSFLSLLLGKRVGPLTLMRTAMVPLFLIAVVNVGLAFSPLGVSHGAWWPVLLPAALLVLAMGIFNPVCQALYLSPFQKNTAGTAAGTAALMQTLGMTVGSAVASQVWQRSAQPSTFYGVLAIAMFVVQIWFWASLGQRRSPPPVAASHPLPQQGAAWQSGDSTV